MPSNTYLLFLGVIALGGNKNKFKIFIIFALGFSAFFAEAQENCGQLFVQSQQQERTLSGLLWETTQDWNTLVGPKLAVENYYVVVVDGRDVTESIFIPYRSELVIGNELYGKDSLSLGVILSHEFGHLIFFDHFDFTWNGKKISFRKVVDEGRKAQENMSTPNSPYQLAVAEKLALQSELAGLHNTSLTNDILALQKKLDDVSKTIEDMRAPNAFFHEVSDMLDAYNELFADILPVIIWRDPYVVFLAGETRNSNGEFDNDRVGTRDHNTEASPPRTFLVNDFKNWKHEKSDKYTLFDPVRGALWSLFLQNLRVDEVPLFFKTFLEAASLHVTFRLARGEDIRVSRQASDPTKINQEFLKLFVMTARKYNLPIRRHQKTDFLSEQGKDIFTF